MDEIKLLRRIERLERALGGHFKWMEPGHYSTPGWKEAQELIDILDGADPEGKC